jgi:hypothetical protein
MVSQQDKDAIRIQAVSVFLIVFAAVCIFIGSKFGYRDLVNFATMFGGGGVGILTGQKMTSNYMNKEGSTMIGTIQPDTTEADAPKV